MSKHCKIPKRIAGVKIPKSLRKGPIGDFLKSSSGRVVLAEALAGLEAIAGRGLSANRERLEGAFRAALHAFRDELTEHDLHPGDARSHAAEKERSVIQH